MYKIQCMTLTPALSANRYRGISGKQYTFQIGVGTEIKDKEDAEYFLKAGKGMLFKNVGTVAKVVDKVKDKAEEIITGKKKEIPKMIEIDKGKFKPNYEYSWDEKELKALNADEQKSLIKDLAGGGTTIPKLEKDKINLILKLKNADKPKASAAEIKSEDKKEGEDKK